MSSKLASVLFADDTTLTDEHSDYETLLTGTVNVDLTLVVCLPRCSSRLGGVFHNTEFNFQVSEKYLGIYLDRDIKFDVHVLNISKKLSKSVGLLYRISFLFLKKVLMNL